MITETRTRRPWRQEAGFIALLFLLPLVMFWSQTLGGRTLLPAENLYQYEPYASHRAEAGAPEVPHNHLLSDLVLQNMQWKSFTLESLRSGEIPLWNPHQFGGIPFLAAGQQSALYPFSILYYTLPLSAAYGWFTVVQLGLAGALMYGYLRAGLGLGKAGSAVGGVVFQLSQFFVISAVFPMIIASAVWLPLLLWMAEWIVRGRPLLGGPARAPWAIIGAVALGMNILAGHIEITYYTLLIVGVYSAARLAYAAVPMVRERTGGLGSALRPAAVTAGWLLAMAALGVALGAVQLIPLFEFVNLNFRSGSASLQQVLDWAHPPRDLLQFALPNFFGSPAQHSLFDVFSGQSTSLIDTVVTNAQGARVLQTEWGMKNYVEAALYVGILPLALALFGLLVPARRAQTFFRPFYALLGLFALLFMFGAPIYGVLYTLLPGFDQLHSPFRWVYALTLAVAVLAAFGMDALAHNTAVERVRRTARWFGIVLLTIGLNLLAGLALARVFYPAIAPLVERVFTGMAKADTVFPDAQAFFSHVFVQVLIFALMVLGSALVFLVLAPKHGPAAGRRLTWGAVGAVLFVAADLMLASWSFNSASDPALLDYSPPAISWLQAQEGQGRFTTLDDPAQPPLFQANLAMRYGLDDARGYESIIPKSYVETMASLYPQTQLDYNRIAPLYTTYPPESGFDARTALESPLLNALNIRWLITHETADLSDVPGFSLAYEDAGVRIWENANAFPRAMMLEGNDAAERADALERGSSVELVSDSGRERIYSVETTKPAVLVISETSLPGWRAYAVPTNDPGAEETPLTVSATTAGLIRIDLPTAGAWQVRAVYSPQSFTVGLFTSFIAVIVLLLISGAFLWSRLVGRSNTAPTDSESEGIGRVARNSVAPIVLNLFNRGIDFAFAFIALRLLGPELAGAYFYAGVIFVWFDIFTNFGLNLFLTREVARDRSRAREIFLNTSVMRAGLTGLGVPLLVAFIAVRQATVSPPLNNETLVAIGLLYIGLIPGSLSIGLTALYYAFERAEMPALVSTVATINKAVLGVMVLVAGGSIIGLAAVSIVTNLLTLGVLFWSGRWMLKRVGPAARVQWSLMRTMAGQSWPLMLNHFLSTIFFQIDVVLIEAFHGTYMVGQYQIAYKWVAALNVIPAYFTQAMLPLLSRQAHTDRAALRRNYILALKLLVSIALPTAVIFTLLAYPLTALLGGPQYLPDGAIATQIMIWSIPIGWMNSFTQYMLVALDLQRRIMWAFVLGVGFNLIANFLLIPQYGFQAAAFTTILSEAVLFVPFTLILRGSVGDLPWLQMLWRPLAATGLMIGAAALAAQANLLLGAVVGSVVYAAAWWFLRTLDANEWALLSPLLPGRLRARLPKTV
ncbi:MAG TPA: oligosaccharide flippase family protein [Candidatus Limnocylindrales bacterium]|nr:oligosaccharide flippase family protein [Candidatus Limnocylindrales bacterium]